MTRLIARFDVAYPGFRLQAELNVPAAGILALFGPSGSGKTTLVRCLAGLERAPDGYLSLGDEVWQDESRHLYVPISRRSIGYVFQDARLFPHLSVQSNLLYGWNRTPAHQRRVSVEQVVNILGIDPLLDRRPHKLSGGEQQRVAIGRALLTSPRLLLLDEPLSSLDTDRKREILPFIQRLYKELQIPIVYVSHSINEIMQLAHHVAFLQQGKIVALGPLCEIFSRLDLHKTLGSNPIGGIIDTTVAAHEPDFGLTRLRFNGHSLYVPFRPLDVGEPLRIHILSSDVSLALGPPSADSSSVLNMLDATVVEIEEVDQSTVDVLLDVGRPLVARITRKSLAQLHLKPGLRLTAHIKAAALIEELTE